MRLNRWMTACLGLLVLGCKSSTFEDPNDPNAVGLQQPEVLQRQLKGASDAFLARRDAGEINDRMYRELLANYARDLLKHTTIESIAPAEAWRYGEVFRTAKQWPQTEALFRIAVKQDGKLDSVQAVNNRLRFAEALAHLGRIKEAIQTARETFACPEELKVPILYGVLYEIAPAAQGQGEDAGVARLLEDSIQEANHAKVDLKTEAGNAFVKARPFHQRNARRMAASLYLQSGLSREAERVMSGNLSGVGV